MHFSAILAAASTLFVSVSAVGVRICYKSPFQECTTVTGGSGQCIYVGSPYNDHVFSANALSDTRYCDSYRDVNNGACSGGLVGGIDQAGYSGLKYGSETSGFVCYA
ncbi:hypothetical protein V492_02873 [Pseudogymnoascus sp. VKM F-4246]|nr:hypothetical protein V492_02873 [Pseudogymnoascus sp. VKM F-4246]